MVCYRKDNFHLNKEWQSIWGSVSQEKGVAAATSWHVLKKGKQASLLQCFPETGRTHQIRVHLSGMGHPILGDHQYGKKFTCSYQAPRCLLHANKIGFIHPFLHKEIAIGAPMPEDFKDAMVSLFGDSFS